MSSPVLYVNGLSIGYRARDLAAHFEQFGRLVRCDIPAPPPNPRTCFAFVEFEDPRDADTAIAEMNGRRIDGMTLRVEWAKNAPSRNWRFDGRTRSRSLSPGAHPPSTGGGSRDGGSVAGGRREYAPPPIDQRSPPPSGGSGRGRENYYDDRANNRRPPHTRGGDYDNDRRPPQHTHAPPPAHNVDYQPYPSHAPYRERDSSRHELYGREPGPPRYRNNRYDDNGGGRFNGGPPAGDRPYPPRRDYRGGNGGAPPYNGYRNDGPPVPRGGPDAPAPPHQRGGYDRDYRRGPPPPREPRERYERTGGDGEFRRGGGEYRRDKGPGGPPPVHEYRGGEYRRDPPGPPRDQYTFNNGSTEFGVNQNTSNNEYPASRTSSTEYQQQQKEPSSAGSGSGRGKSWGDAGSQGGERQSEGKGGWGEEQRGAPPVDRNKDLELGW